MRGPPKSRHLEDPIQVSLEELVPRNHFSRHRERTLDLAFVRDLVREASAEIGRPSIDPVVFFKLHLVLFFEGLRSERQLLRVVADRLRLRWQLGDDLSEAPPDHSSLTRIRERSGVEIFRRFFDVVVAHCIAAGLVWGQERFIDSTDVDAKAAIDSLHPRFAVEAPLVRLFAEKDKHGGDDPGGDAGPTQLPVALTEEARSDLAKRAADRHDGIGEMGRPDRTKTSGPYRRIADYRASATDPDAAPLRPSDRGAHLGCHDHDVVDGGKARIILTVLVTPAEVQDNQPAVDLLWRTRFRGETPSPAGDRRPHVRRHREHRRHRGSAHTSGRPAFESWPARGRLRRAGRPLRSGRRRLPLSGRKGGALPVPERWDASADLPGAGDRLQGMCAPGTRHDLTAGTTNQSQP